MPRAATTPTAAMANQPKTSTGPGVSASASPIPPQIRSTNLLRYAPTKSRNLPSSASPLTPKSRCTKSSPYPMGWMEPCTTRLRTHHHAPRTPPMPATANGATTRRRPTARAARRYAARIRSGRNSAGALLISATRRLAAMPAATSRRTSPVITLIVRYSSTDVDEISSTSLLTDAPTRTRLGIVSGIRAATSASWSRARGGRRSERSSRRAVAQQRIGTGSIRQMLTRRSTQTWRSHASASTPGMSRATAYTQYPSGGCWIIWFGGLPPAWPFPPSPSKLGRSPRSAMGARASGRSGGQPTAMMSRRMALPASVGRSSPGS